MQLQTETQSSESDPAECGRFGDLCVLCDCCVLVCLQVYYVENINSGSADMEEVVQQVNHYSHASAKKEIKHPREFILFNKVMSVKVLKKIKVTNVCVSQVSLSQLSGSQVDSLLERLRSACTGES